MVLVHLPPTRPVISDCEEQLLCRDPARSTTVWSPVLYGVPSWGEWTYFPLLGVDLRGAIASGGAGLLGSGAYGLRQDEYRAIHLHPVT